MGNGRNIGLLFYFDIITGDEYWIFADHVLRLQSGDDYAK